jgi:hypothetical protein
MGLLSPKKKLSHTTQKGGGRGVDEKTRDHYVCFPIAACNVSRALSDFCRACWTTAMWHIKMEEWGLMASAFRKWISASWNLSCACVMIKYVNAVTKNMSVGEIFVHQNFYQLLKFTLQRKGISNKLILFFLT